jgi:hypothetical protein
MAATGLDDLGAAWQAAQLALIAPAVCSGRYSPSARGHDGCARGAFWLVDLGATHY